MAIPMSKKATSTPAPPKEGSHQGSQPGAPAPGERTKDHGELFRDICDNAEELIQSIAPDGRFLYTNRAWQRLLGYTKEDLKQVRLFDIVHPSCRDKCAAALRQVLSGSEPVRIEAVFKAKDGRKVEIEGSASCRFEDGKPVATRGIFRDVTRRNEEMESHEKLWDLSLDLLCVANVDGYFLRINPAFCDVLGYTEKELTSRRFVEFIHPDDREATEKEIVHLAEGKLVVDFKNRYRAADGRYRWLAWRSAPLADRGLIYAVARDVTEAMRVEELMKSQAADLERSNKDLESFAYVASHDLRAPLRVVANLADWIEEDLPGEVPEKVKGHLARMRERLERLENLTSDLLKISRADSISSAVEEVDTARMVREIAEELSPPEGIEVEPKFGLPRFRTPRAALEQVLRNLIGNAIKHHDRPAGKVEVSANEAGRHYEFWVTDDGPGIPASERRQIFDMFHRLRSGEGVEGEGMGLAMAKRIVQRMGGSIRVEGGGERGSAFIFTWPRSEPTAPDDSGETRDAQDSGRR